MATNLKIVATLAGEFLSWEIMLRALVWWLALQVEFVLSSNDTSATCYSIKQAYQSSSCCTTDLAKTTGYVISPQVPKYVSYSYTTEATLIQGLQTYTKIKSATCGDRMPR